MNINGSTANITGIEANISTPKRSGSLNISKAMQSIETLITSLNFNPKKNETKFMKAVKENDASYVKQKLMKHPELVGKLLKESGYEGKFTPLGLACYHANLRVMSQLIKVGADINQVDYNGASPLMFAVESGSLDAVKFLLKRRPNVNQKDNMGNNCSAVAAADGKLEILKVLVEHGVNIHNRTTNNKTNILMVACVHGHLDIVRFLHAKGMDVNEQTAITKTTALHFAAERGHAEIVNFLLEKGANPNLADIDGHRPLCFTKSGKDEQIIKMLIESQQKTI